MSETDAVMDPDASDDLIRISQQAFLTHKFWGESSNHKYLLGTNNIYNTVGNNIHEMKSN